MGTFVFRRDDPGRTADGQLLGSSPSPSPSPSHAASTAAAAAAWPEWSQLGRFRSLFIDAGRCGMIVDAEGIQVRGRGRQGGAGRQEGEF